MSLESLKFAGETTKQIITLATGVSTLTITFADKFKPANAALSVPGTLKYSWGAFGLTVFFGILTLMAITGSINEAKGNPAEGDAQSWNIRLPAMAMVACFFAALALTIDAGIAVVR